MKRRKTAPVEQEHAAVRRAHRENVSSSGGSGGSDDDVGAAEHFGQEEQANSLADIAVSGGVGRGKGGGGA